MTSEFNDRVRENYPNGYVTTVTSCARCGGTHEGLEFDPLDNPADDWMFWAMCPKVKQPILGAMVETPQTLKSLEALEKKGDQ